MRLHVVSTDNPNGISRLICCGVCAHVLDQMRASDDSGIRASSNIHPTQTTAPTMSARALWFMAATKKSAQNTLYMQCNVKPGASKTREGVSSVDDEAVGICVAAQAREGEANNAVIRVLSEVCISQFCPPPPLLFNHIPRSSTSPSQTSTLPKVSSRGAKPLLWSVLGSTRAKRSA